jgi:hypothetical protein
MLISSNYRFPEERAYPSLISFFIDFKFAEGFALTLKTENE